MNSECLYTMLESAVTSTNGVVHHENLKEDTALLGSGSGAPCFVSIYSERGRMTTFLFGLP